MPLTHRAGYTMLVQSTVALALFRSDGSPVFDWLTSHGRLSRRRKAFAARALGVKKWQILSVFDTEDDELAVYHQRQRGKVWLVLVGTDGVLQGPSEFIGDYGQAIEHISAHMGDT